MSQSKPKAASPIPAGYHALTPYFCLTGANAVIDFLIAAFDAEVVHRTTRPDGSLWHADLLIAGDHLMLSEASEQWKARPSAIYFYVPDTDITYQRALAAGGVSIMEPTDTHYGDRNAGVEDPSGTQWWIATRIEDLDDAELERRGKEATPRSRRGSGVGEGG